ncbi:hypothetical protein QOL99_02920 [Deinococcus sp. MIMF12]|uniref:Uncharacterized protein n=1 Tax=Deinococcus rhizophilus TaxID=3049544 RepID=A0ABT7JEV3_9DEIO|nr:hypothetical protein [Deinococcus rhizophilus]MDL2343097.1 hypothetical protein [Deinococcus rhizophilus]
MTGVEWACLCAYARTLPPGPVRRAVRALALGGRPDRMGVALVTAAGLGYLHRGRLTPQGEAVARAFLRREGLGL